MRLHRPPLTLPTDERRTPVPLFETCNAVWGPFDLDAAAAAWNHQVARYVDKTANLFQVRPRAKRVWLNPPYSRGNLGLFLGLARELILDRTWGLCTTLIPLDASTDWWRCQVARPEGEPLRCEWLYCCYPAPLQNATRYISELLTVTVVPVEGRQAFDPRRTSERAGRDDKKHHGAKQPSCVVTFERTVHASGCRSTQIRELRERC